MPKPDKMWPGEYQCLFWQIIPADMNFAGAFQGVDLPHLDRSYVDHIQFQQFLVGNAGSFLLRFQNPMDPYGPGPNGSWVVPANNIGHQLVRVFVKRHFTGRERIEYTDNGGAFQNLQTVLALYGYPREYAHLARD